MATISSGTFDFRSGDGSVDITHASFPDTTFVASALSSVKVTPDEEEEGNEARQIYTHVGELNLSAFDRLGNGSSLFDVIDAVTSTDEIALSFSFTTNDGRSWDEDYIFTPQDVSYDYRRREISIVAQPDTNFTQSVRDIFDNNPADVETVVNFVSQNTTEDCMPASRFIDNVLPFFNSTNTNVNNSDNYLTDGQTDGVESYIIVDYITAASNDLAVDTLFKLAVAEGSIVGSVMGYNYFTNRLDQTQKVTISKSDVQELNPKIGLRSYATIRGVCDLGGESWWSAGHLTGDADNLNDDAEKRLDYYFKDKYIDIATWDNANTRYDQGAGVKSAGDLADVSIDGDHKKGLREISLTTGSGSTSLTSGDLIWIQSSGGAARNIFYVVDTANASTLVLETPLIKSISDEDEIVIIADNTINELVESGVASYAKSYGADGANRIELEVFGIDTIKPYESFELDSTFEDPLKNKVYRASEIEYMFGKDIIKIKAYQIA